jgi:hypothetical protein
VCSGHEESAGPNDGDALTHGQDELSTRQTGPPSNDGRAYATFAAGHVLRYFPTYFHNILTAFLTCIGVALGREKGEMGPAHFEVCLSSVVVVILVINISISVIIIIIIIIIIISIIVIFIITVIIVIITVVVASLASFILKATIGFGIEFGYGIKLRFRQ